MERSKREEENEGIGAYKKKKKEMKGSLMDLGLPQGSRRGWPGP